MHSQQGYVERSGYKLYYETFGRGFPILLVHGILGCGRFMNHAATWELGDWLAELRFKALAFDQYGFGESTRATDLLADYFWRTPEDIIALLDHLKIDQVVVIGVCEGAVAALNLAIRYPERVVAVVADSPGYQITEDMLEADADPDNALEEAWQRLLEETHGLDYAASLIKARHELLKQLAQEKTDLYQGRLGEIKCPTLLTACSGDIYRLNRQTREIGAQIPGAQVKIYRGGGQPVMWTLNPQFAPELEAFLFALLRSR